MYWIWPAQTVVCVLNVVSGRALGRTVPRRRGRLGNRPEYLRAFRLGPIVATPTSLSIGSSAKFHSDAREHGWRSEFVRPYVQRERLYMALYMLIRAAQDMCI